jgi:flagellar protein FliO/FliZ
MSLFSSDTGSVPTTPRRLARYGLYLVGTMVALWVVTQAIAMQPSGSKPEPQSTDRALQSTDSTMVASSASGGASRIEIFTWGNVAAFLLLAGGGGAALYLHQNRAQTRTTTPFRPLGKMALGSSKHIRLVACGDEVLLLSVTDDEISLLKTYAHDAFEDVEGIKLDAGDCPSPAERPAAPPGEWSESFADVLNRFADRTPYS